MTALDHVGLSVTNLEAQADGYANALGLDKLVADPEGHLIEMLDRPGPPGTPVEAS